MFVLKQFLTTYQIIIPCYFFLFGGVLYYAVLF